MKTEFQHNKLISIFYLVNVVTYNIDSSNKFNNYLTTYIMQLKILILGAFLFIFNVSYGQNAFKPDSVKSQKNDLRSFLNRNSGLLIPVLFIGSATYIHFNDDFYINAEIREEQKENLSAFEAKADDVLQFGPIAEGYMLHLAGFKAKDGLGQATWKLAKAELLMMGLVTASKHFTQSRRPDSGKLNSFPSGHTAQAFLAASFLHEEFGDHHPLISISGFAMATAVGTMRVLNGRHWATDVLAGAGFGMLSWQLVSLTHRGSLFGKSNNLMLAPTSNGKGYYGLNALYRF